MKRTIIALSTLLLALGSATASAQAYSERAGTWDFGLQAAGSGSLSVSGEMGSGLNIESELGWGIGGAYNFTNRLALGFDMIWVKPDYTATYFDENTNSPVTIRHRADFWNFQARGLFYFVEGPVAPYVEVGAGWTRIDSNVASGPPTTGCWWDPWWGYVCRNFWSTYGDSRFSYSGTVGLRWDINRDFGLKGSYGNLWLDTSSGSTPKFDMYRAEFIWRF